ALFSQLVLRRKLVLRPREWRANGRSTPRCPLEEHRGDPPRLASNETTPVSPRSRNASCPGARGVVRCVGAGNFRKATGLLVQHRCRIPPVPPRSETCASSFSETEK